MGLPSMLTWNCVERGSVVGAFCALQGTHATERKPITARKPLLKRTRRKHSHARQVAVVAVDLRATGSLAIRNRGAGANIYFAPRPEVAGYRKDSPPRLLLI
jgi:hypothetical protein